jgi:DNA-binding NarL/FixJ family response regulator
MSEETSVSFNAVWTVTSLFRIIVAGWLFVLVLSTARAQVNKPAPPKSEDPYRQFMKKPETAQEFWAAMRFEIEVGKFNLAAEDLKGFLARKPTDQDLLEIEKREGMSAFLRLLTIKDLREDAKPLLERVTAVVKAHYGDPQRIKQLIGNLRASPEEREYAITELRRSGAAAVPPMVEALASASDVGERGTIGDALVQLPRNAGPPLWAALDAADASFLIQLIDVIERRGEDRAVGWLWYASASPKIADVVRRRASHALSVLTGQRADQFPAAKLALTREAEMYYVHQVRLPEPVTVWQWKDKGLTSQTMTSSQAEEYYGLKFARQALELDPGYEPAQVIFVSLALEKAYGRAGLHQPLEKGAPAAGELLKTINPDLVNTALDRALAEHRLAVIAGAVRALGELGDARSLRPLSGRTPALVRALYYPDRRVQLAAADAILRIPGKEALAHGARIVDNLSRTLAADATPRAIVADANSDRAFELAHVIQAIGFDPVVRSAGRDVLRRLREAADVDVVVVDAGIPDSPLPYLLAQLRGDVNFGLLPVIIVAPTDHPGIVPEEIERGLNRFVQGYRNVSVVARTLDQAFWKQTLAARRVEAEGSPLTKEERLANAKLAMQWLRRLAVGEVPGYDVGPAERAILKALKTADLEGEAIQAAGRLPGRRAQVALAEAVLNSPTPALQTAAAAELARHIRAHDLALPIEQIRGIESLYRSSTDAKLRESLALLLGSFRPSAQITGTRLQRYDPNAPPPPKPVPKEK